MRSHTPKPVKSKTIHHEDLDDLHKVTGSRYLSPLRNAPSYDFDNMKSKHHIAKYGDCKTRSSMYSKT